MQFNGFSFEGIKFLKKLENNNTKVWFENNRTTWEKYILLPNTNFVQEMGETLQILVPTIHFKSKVSGSLFRIYRDVRFSKDKTPMKNKIGVMFWQGQAHRMQSSCFYIQYNKENYLVASGIRSFKPPLLKAYRKYIKHKKHRESLHVILEDLKAKGYSITEPKYKRVPAEFDKNEEYVYLTKYASMFVFIEYKLDDIFFTPQIVDKVFKLYQDMFKLQQWVYKMSLSV
ncbi:DUF2461 domain-containing protein [Sulfurospirillum sp.]|nr:DUF2461 domain-containing protein [Sulfurospirillum sp.]